MRRCWLLLLLIVLWGCSGSAGAWGRIQQAGVLRVGMDPTYPPFEVLDGSGEFAGIDVDLARALGEELGLAVHLEPISYDGLYDALATKHVDVLLSGMVVDPARTRDFAYGDPYFNAGQVLVVRGETAVIRTIDDLSNQRLGVELGAEGHVQATVWARRLPELQVVPYDAPDVALSALLAGEVEAVVVDSINGRLFVKDQPILQILPEPVTVEPFALVVRAEDEQLLEVLNGALEKVEGNGRLAEIFAFWLGEGN